MVEEKEFLKGDRKNVLSSRTKRKKGTLRVGHQKKNWNEKTRKRKRLEFETKKGKKEVFMGSKPKKERKLELKFENIKKL